MKYVSISNVYVGWSPSTSLVSWRSHEILSNFFHLFIFLWMKPKNYNQKCKIAWAFFMHFCVATQLNWLFEAKSLNRQHKTIFNLRTQTKRKTPYVKLAFLVQAPLPQPIILIAYYHLGKEKWKIQNN